MENYAWLWKMKWEYCWQFETAKDAATREKNVANTSKNKKKRDTQLNLIGTIAKNHLLLGIK